MWQRGAVNSARFWLVLVLVGGCGDKVHAPRDAGPDPLPMEDYPQITALEKLHRVIVVSEVKEESGPPLRVTVAARNKTNDDERNIQYRFLFLDEKGLPENANPDWHYLHMPARTLVYLSGNALDVKAKSWRLEMRPSR